MTIRVDKKAITRVAKQLIPSRVLLVRSIVDLGDILSETGENISVQYSNPVCESFRATKIDESLYEYAFDVVTGVRFLDSDRCDEEESDPDECVIGLISAQFTVLYHSHEEDACTNSDLEEFSKQNALFHAWPYWREFNQSACTRAGVTPPPIGVFMIDKFKSTEDGDSEQG